MTIFFAALITRLASAVDSVRIFLWPRRLTFQDRYFLYLQDTLPYEFDETEYPSEVVFRREYPEKYELVMKYPRDVVV